MGIIALAPHLAGLLSPFPVFGVVMAVFTHRTHGASAAVSVLDGLIMGLAAPPSSSSPWPSRSHRSD
ncbi:hypothetical protein QFZ22_000613 [Streptomyces canus]|uniref:Major facilitator superfamily (MFS) profile domain-containing protein n=1 Tax=Streptomyces canus TaxID=58343 RepID=A0AAW8F773_9ACTN|nr:hypothetical protein [Streptomyces canus]MDQ0904628.1 hypothetical protein [Streptomyces canus]